MIDERTLQMRKNYIQHWRDGWTPTRVAKHYNLSPQTVYDSLGEIAKQYGMTRDELLDVPHMPHTPSSRPAHLEPCDYADVERLFGKTLELVSETRMALNAYLEQSEKHFR